MTLRNYWSWNCKPRAALSPWQLTQYHIEIGETCDYRAMQSEVAAQFFHNHASFNEVGALMVIDNTISWCDSGGYDADGSGDTGGLDGGGGCDGGGGYPPTLILGPGEPEMAHKTDEFCHISKIEEGVEIYTKIAEEWCK